MHRLVAVFAYPVISGIAFCLMFGPLYLGAGLVNINHESRPLFMGIGGVAVILGFVGLGVHYEFAKFAKESTPEI